MSSVEYLSQQAPEDREELGSTLHKNPPETLSVRVAMEAGGRRGGGRWQRAGRICKLLPVPRHALGCYQRPVSQKTSLKGTLKQFARTALSAFKRGFRFKI